MAERNSGLADRLIRYLEGELTSSEAREIEGELEASAELQSQLEQARALLTALRRPRPELESVDLTVRIRRQLGAPKPPSRGLPWRMALGAAVAAAAAFVVIPRLQLGDAPGEAPPRSRSAADHEDRWHGIHVFEIVDGASRPLADTMESNAKLAFTYTNLGDRAAGYLMIFGIDATGQIRWYHPAYETAGQNPQAIAIEETVADAALPDAVSHELPTGPYAIHAVFTDRALRVEEVEKRAGDPDMSAGLGLDVVTHQVIKVDVR